MVARPHHRARARAAAVPASWPGRRARPPRAGRTTPRRGRARRAPREAARRLPSGIARRARAPPRPGRTNRRRRRPAPRAGEPRRPGAPRGPRSASSAVLRSVVMWEPRPPRRPLQRFFAQEELADAHEPPPGMGLHRPERHAGAARNLLVGEPLGDGQPQDLPLLRAQVSMARVASAASAEVSMPPSCPSSAGPPRASGSASMERVIGRKDLAPPIDEAPPGHDGDEDLLRPERGVVARAVRPQVEEISWTASSTSGRVGDIRRASRQSVRTGPGIHGLRPGHQSRLGRAGAGGRAALEVDIASSERRATPCRVGQRSLASERERPACPDERAGGSRNGLGAVPGESAGSRGRSHR